MYTRKALMTDLDELAAIEAECFSAAEAGSRDTFRKRLEVYPGHFLLLCGDDGKVISFTNGLVTDQPDLTDEMYADTSLHNENGTWQMVFGLLTRPEYRRQGHAARLLNEFAENARAEGRKGLVLTCKEQLIPFYEKLGFVSEGVSRTSFHAGIEWYQMRKSFI